MMSATASPSKPSKAADHAPSRLPSLSSIRVAGGTRIEIIKQAGHNVVASVSERDGYKVRFPRFRDTPEGIFINTGGGVVSGDTVQHNISVAADASAVFSTQSAERIYRARGQETTRLKIELSLSERSELSWLPQETILFNNVRLRRTIKADMPISAKLLLSEICVFGRSAMGETVTNGSYHDRWRIKRDSRLLFADDIRLEGQVSETLAQRAVAQGATATATILYVANDAADKLPATRAILSELDFEAAASSWNGFLLVRAFASSTERIRAMIATISPMLSGRALPRVWWT